MKICKKCKQELPLTDFYKQKKPDGSYVHRPRCKECACEEQRARWKLKPKKPKKPKKIKEPKVKKVKEPKVKKVKVKRFCSVDGCDRPYYGKGYCRIHYGRIRRNGNIFLQAAKKYSEKCSLEGCEHEYYAKGYCRNHYDQIRRRSKNGLENGLQQPLEKGVEKTSKEPIIQKCKVKYCENTHYTQGYCRDHYHAMLRKMKKLNKTIQK